MMIDKVQGSTMRLCSVPVKSIIRDDKGRLCIYPSEGKDVRSPSGKLLVILVDLCVAVYMSQDETVEYLGGHSQFEVAKQTP